MKKTIFWKSAPRLHETLIFEGPGSQKHPQSQPTTLQRSLKNGIDFWRTFGPLLAEFGGVSGTLGPSRWVFRVSEVLIFKNSSFSCLGWLFVDFVMFWGALGSHFGNQNGAKSPPMRRPKGGPKWGMEMERLFRRNVALAGAIEGFLRILGTWFEKEREAR